MSDIRLDLAVHEFACPHCEKWTQHSWPGSTILFSTAKCQHCGMEFLVVQNKPWLGDDRANGQSL
jgi:transcription elongation factor Elf1